MPGWLKKLLNPKVLIPVVVMVAAVALLFAIGDPRKIIAIMKSFNRMDLIWVFLLSVVYEAVRFVQWFVLLKDEGVKVPMKAQIFSFSGGEVTRFVPIGNYFQNYLLTVAEGADFAYTSAATTLIIIFEVAVSVTGLVILGLGNWGWVRPVVGGGTLATVLIVWLIYRFHGTLEPPGWVRRSARARTAWEGAAGQLHEFGRGTKRILHWRTLAISYGLAAIYLIAAGGVLYVVLAGLGWTRTPFTDVLAVYFFSLAIGLVFPLPADIGVTEVSGVGAFLVVGVDRDTAIGAMLINRVLTIVFSIVIASIVTAVLRDEFMRALRERGARKTGQLGHEAGKQDGEPADEEPADEEPADEDQSRGGTGGDPPEDPEGDDTNPHHQRMADSSPSPPGRSPDHHARDSGCDPSAQDISAG